MIGVHFSIDESAPGPYIHLDLGFPDHPTLGAQSVEFLIDTGADISFLSPVHAERVELDVSSLDVAG